MLYANLTINLIFMFKKLCCLILKKERSIFDISCYIIIYDLLLFNSYIYIKHFFKLNQNNDKLQNAYTALFSLFNNKN